MAPPKLYISRKDIHVNIEEDIKEIGDILKLQPKTVLKRGYFYSIDEHIERFGASAELKEKWLAIKIRDAEEFNLKIQEEKKLEEFAKKNGEQKKIQDNEDNELIRVWDIGYSDYLMIPKSQFNPIVHRLVR